MVKIDDYIEHARNALQGHLLIYPVVLSAFTHSISGEVAVAQTHTPAPNPSRFTFSWTRIRGYFGTGAGLPPWWIELVIIAAGYLLYQGVQIFVTGSAASAVSRANWIWDVQSAMHLNPEVAINHWVAGNDFLLYSTGYFYGILHFAVTPLVLIWVRFRHRNHYAMLRNVLVGTSLVALIMYWVVPLAPPRLSMGNIVDTLRVENILSAADPSGPASMANQYAAMPSLHVAWAVWVALALYVCLRPRSWRWAVWLYPAATTFVVIGTGNHFIADAVAGALLVWLCWFVASRVHATMRGPQQVSANNYMNVV